jgi:hypothetical protein
MKFRLVWLMFLTVAIASCATPDQGDEDAGSTGEGGTTGNAGTNGGAGLAGTTGSGVAGTMGTTGAAGKSGVAGTTGAAGTSGEAGTSGAAGTAGGAGRGGASGLAGTNGAGGRGGATGGAGITGAAGTSGIAGRGGTTGAAGTAGTAGRGGTTGAGGTSGAAGRGGTTGAAGTTGSGGTGTPGLGAWTTGYAATMYGNDSSGDCDGYPDFGDTTNIDSQTCTKVVSIASYSAGVANNASYYGATGDLSSLWGGAECSCNGNDTCPSNQAPSCPAESQSGGNCGICVAVKCDPNGTFSLSGTTHDQDCDKTHYVVVQIIDACPHDHPTNVASSEGWCTSRQANHVDLSCSALGGISTKGMNIGQDGWLNVDVQKVDCSLGLGLHSL